MSNKASAYIQDGIDMAVSIIKGHVVTFKNLFRKKSTMQYPEERWTLPDGYRGVPCLPVDPETGKDICIGCGSCARICPTQLITVETHMGEDKKRVVDGFVMNIGRCMFCGLCAEICPVNAIVMSKEYELAEYTRDDMIYDRARLNAVGGIRPPKQADENTRGDDDASDN